MELQLALMDANAADEFARVLTDTHGKLSEADAGLAALVEATPDWR